MLTVSSSTVPASDQVTTCPTGRLPPSGQHPRALAEALGDAVWVRARRERPPQITTFQEAAPSPAVPESPGWAGPCRLPVPSGPSGDWDREGTNGRTLSFPGPATSAAPRVTPGRNYRERALGPTGCSFGPPVSPPGRELSVHTSVSRDLGGGKRRDQTWRSHVILKGPDKQGLGFRLLVCESVLTLATCRRRVDLARLL